MAQLDKQTHTHTHTLSFSVSLSPGRLPWTNDYFVTETNTTHYQHKRRKPTPSAGFETTIPALEQLQTSTLVRLFACFLLLFGATAHLRPWLLQSSAYRHLHPLPNFFNSCAILCILSVLSWAPFRPLSSPHNPPTGACWIWYSWSAPFPCIFYGFHGFICLATVL